MAKRRIFLWSSVFLAVILLLGSFLRLYRLRETLMFQGDQGRDAIVVKHMIRDGKLTLLGPATSVGSMYLGPFYYYFMAPFLAITYPDPIGPAFGVALLGIATIWLVYHVGTRAFSQTTGLIAACIYALMPVAAEYSRFSWNPNLAPFFALVLMYSVWLAVTHDKHRWWLVAALAFGILIQLHYVALLSGAMIAAGWIVTFGRRPKQRKTLLLYAAGMVATVAATALPLVLFDFRHEHLIWKAFTDFFTSPEQHVQPLSRLATSIAEIQGRSFRVVAQLMGSPNGIIDRVVVYGSITLLLLALFGKRVRFSDRWGLGLLVTWIAAAVVGTSFYSSGIFNHYVAFVFPALALFFGYLITLVFRVGSVGRVVTIGALLAYSGFCLTKAPAFAPKMTGIDDYARVAEAALPAITQYPYNIVLLSGSRDYKGMNYRYFFEVSAHPPQDFENYDGLRQLVIIDEAQTPEPLSVPIYEIQTPKLTQITQTLSLPHDVRVLLVSGDGIQ